MRRLVFIKTLSTTDIQYRLHFPTYHLDLLPFAEGRREVEFQVRYGENPGRITFRCIKRRGRDPKPTITRGWSEMVRRKGLAEGDLLKFYVEDGQPALCQIEVLRFRQTRLFGSMVGTWANIP